MTDYGTFEEEECRLARALMRLEQFEGKAPIAASELVRFAGKRECIVSILPDEDPHCIWSALCEDQPEPRSMRQLPGRRDRVAVYVRATHPSIEESSNAGRLFGSQWVWEDEL